jgi:hypothetical protein
VARSICLIAIAIALMGCGTPVDYYQPPESTAPENVATVVGSKIEMSAANKDLRTVLASVDGKPIGARRGGRESWERPVLIPDGERELLIIVTGGESLFKSSRHGFITTKVRLKAGMAYVLRSAIRREGFRGAEAVAWVEEESGVPVTQEVEFRMTYPPPSVMPIIIPAK